MNLIIIHFLLIFSVLSLDKGSMRDRRRQRSQNLQQKSIENQLDRESKIQLFNPLDYTDISNANLNAPLYCTKTKDAIIDDSISSSSSSSSSTKKFQMISLESLYGQNFAGKNILDNVKEKEMILR